MVTSVSKRQHDCESVYIYSYMYKLWGFIFQIFKKTYIYIYFFPFKLKRACVCQRRTFACFGLLPNTLQWQGDCNGKILLSLSGEAVAPGTPSWDAEVSEVSNWVNFVVLQACALKDTTHSTTSVTGALTLPIPEPHRKLGGGSRKGRINKALHS